MRTLLRQGSVIGIYFSERYASRELSCDQSSSAAPARYGLGCPPSVGTAQMPMSPLVEAYCLRTQHVTREPSGENPRVRTDRLTSSQVNF